MNTYVEVALNISPAVLLGALTVAQIIGAISYPFVAMLADKVGVAIRTSTRSVTYCYTHFVRKHGDEWVGDCSNDLCDRERPE